MYLHLGQDTVVRQQEVLGIFDIENTTVSKATRQYLSLAQRQGRVEDVTGELPKSFVVVTGPGGWKVYISQISAATLRKRAGFLGQVPQEGRPPARRQGQDGSGR